MLFLKTGSDFHLTLFTQFDPSPRHRPLAEYNFINGDLDQFKSIREMSQMRPELNLGNAECIS